MIKILPMKNKGFTLVELMVVIAIIAFLSAVGIAVYADAQSKGRDAKRRTDIDSIAKVLEMHRTDATNYVRLDNPKWFGSSVGLPTADSKGRRYCISSNATGADIDDALPANWNTDTKECTPGTSGYVNISTATPSSGDTTWKICTLLENPANAVYCRYNIQ